MSISNGDLNVDIGAKLDKFDKALDQMQKDFRKASGRLEQQSRKASGSLQNSLGGAFSKIGALAATAFAADRLASFAFEAVQLAGKLEGVERAFNRLNNPSLLSELRTATRGTVSDLELMQAAVRANNFKVPLEKLGTFFKFATQRAAETGENVDYLVNSIVDGIGRKSTLLLDNLGISATELQAEVKKVGDFGQAAGNIIERSMRKGAEETLTAAQQTAVLKAEMANLQAEIGEQLTPAFNGLLSVINQTLGGFKIMIDQFRTGLGRDEMADALKEVEVSFSRITTAIDNAKNSEKELAEYIGKTADALANAQTALEKGETVNDAHKTRLEQQVVIYTQLLEKLQGYGKGQTAVKGAVELTNDELERQIALLQAQRMASDLDWGMETQANDPNTRGERRQDAWNEMTSFEAMDNELQGAINSATEFLEVNKDIGATIGQSGQIGGDVFNLMLNSFNGLSNAADDFGAAFENAIANMLIEVARLFVRLIALKTLMAGLNLIAPGSGTALGAVIGKGMMGLPRFADGGMVTGPTLAMIGDNSSGKEAVIPFEKMGQFLGQYGGGNQNIRVSGLVRGRGEELIVTLDKAGARRSNFYVG